MWDAHYVGDGTGQVDRLRKWKTFQLKPPNSAATDSRITAISRGPGHMEIWCVAPNGSVQDALWYTGKNWNQFTLPAK